MICLILITATVQAAPVEQWNKTFGGINSDYAKSVQQTSDGGYILAGFTTSYWAGYHDAWLIKTDTNGNQLWNKTFGGTNVDAAHSVQQTSDGGYILAGGTTSYGEVNLDTWLIKTDTNGNLQWNKTFGGIKDEWTYSVQQTSDGGYILAGHTYSYGAGGSDAWLIKTDTNGNLQWNKTFGGISDEWAYSVQQTSDGGYILAGHTYSYGAGGSDAWLIRTDGSGTEQWSKTFGGTADDFASSVQQTSDGKYIFSGSTNSYGAGNNDAWLIKVSEEPASDTTPPVWAPIPLDQSVELGKSFSYDVNATDFQAIMYTINDTINFLINSSTGLITNNTILGLGVYGLNITATDVSDNAISKVITVTVQDTTPPIVTNLIVTPQLIYMNQSVNILVDVTDADQFTVNASIIYPNAIVSTFQMFSDSSYKLEFNDTSQYGIYNVTIIAEDASGNINDTAKSGFAVAYQYINPTVNTTANVTKLIDTYNETCVSLEVLTDQNTSGTIHIMRSPVNITGTSIFEEPHLGIFIEINVSKDLKDNLTWCLFKLFYTDEDIESFIEESLSLYIWNETSNKWEKFKKGIPPCVDTGIDTDDNYIWANVTHLSIFTIGATPTPTPTSTILPTPSKNGVRGGGGVSSDEDPENISYSGFVRLYLIEDQPATYYFGDCPINSIELIPLASYGMVTAKVEVLKGPSSGTSDAEIPDGVLYDYFNIYLGYSGWSKGRISSAVINFDIPAEWIEENKIDPSSVTMYRYHEGQYQPLETSLGRQDDGYYYYSAQTSGFSAFIIVGQPSIEVILKETVTATEVGTETVPEKAETPIKKGIPGFGILAGVIVILIVVYAKKK